MRRPNRKALLITGSLLAFCLLALEASLSEYAPWDLAAARWIQSIDLPGFSSLMHFVTLLGNDWIPWAITGAVCLPLIFSGRRLEGVLIISGVAAGGIVNRLLKLIIGRPRPSPELLSVSLEHSTQSFPSGHVSFFVEFFGFLIFLSATQMPRGALRSLIQGTCAVLILLVGISRVYVGAHWPSDTLGSYLYSSAWLAGMITVYSRIRSGK